MTDRAERPQEVMGGLSMGLAEPDQIEFISYDMATGEQEFRVRLNRTDARQVAVMTLACLDQDPHPPVPQIDEAACRRAYLAGQQSVISMIESLRQHRHLPVQGVDHEEQAHEIMDIMLDHVLASLALMREAQPPVQETRWAHDTISPN